MIPVLVLTLFLAQSCAKAERTVTESPQPKKTGFELTFGDDFNAGMNYVDDIGISIVIIVDASGSMSHVPNSGGRPKYIQAANALKTVALYLESLSKSQADMKMNVAVLSFSDQVRTILPLTALDPDGIAKLKAVCVPESFTPTGGTAVGLALEKGAEILAQSGTIFNSMLLVSDGANTIDPAPETVIKAIYGDKNNKSTADYPVRTSTQLLSIIGFDVNSPIFDRLHELGARITSAGDQAELEKSLKSLLEADITKLEGI